MRDVEKLTSAERELFLERSRNLEVLLVEDDPLAREQMAEILHLYFSRVDTASDGKDGLDKYVHYYNENGHNYDLVLTDLNMPTMNGIEMIERILLRNNRQAIVVLSAHDDPTYLIRLIELEVGAFVLKPINVDRLESVLSKQVEILYLRRQFRHHNEILQQEKDAAQHSSQQKSLFLANMSHEIRTPLNAIVGFISLLDEEETDPKKRSYLKVVRSASDSLLQIIDDILDLSKIESGKLEIEAVDFDPYGDLITVAELFQAKAAEKGVVFKIKYNNDMPKALYGDVLRIKQIFSNLLSNAIKFTPEGSIVKSVIWYKNGYLNIRVKDYGIGISKEKQERIFDPFMQAEESTTREYGGTGLGLAICSKLTWLLGGTLSLDSETGKGSNFLLRIPMEAGKVAVPKKNTDSQEDAGTLSGHVLVVDDQSSNRMFLQIVLEGFGLECDSAVDGLDAVEKFGEKHYDLILMDENMPRLDGIGAMREIRQIEKEDGREHTPIVSVTANALKGDRERFMNEGFDDYISKPVTPEVMQKVLKRFLP